jgi:hypothetical protein
MIVSRAGPCVPGGTDAVYDFVASPFSRVFAVLKDGSDGARDGRRLANSKG